MARTAGPDDELARSADPLLDIETILSPRMSTLASVSGLERSGEITVTCSIRISCAVAEVQYTVHATREARELTHRDLCIRHSFCGCGLVLTLRERVLSIKQSAKSLTLD
jgi:hypothetical protein